MKKICLLFTLVCGCASASNWQILSQTEKYNVFIDASSIAKSGRYKKAWLSYSYSGDQQGVAATGYKSYRSTKTLEYFSCEERVSGTIQQIFYSGEYGSGESVGTVVLQLPQVIFSEVAPDTIGEANLNYVCKPSANKAMRSGKV